MDFYSGSSEAGLSQPLWKLLGLPQPQQPGLIGPPLPAPSSPRLIGPPVSVPPSGGGPRLIGPPVPAPGPRLIGPPIPAPPQVGIEPPVGQPYPAPRSAVRRPRANRLRLANLMMHLGGYHPNQ